MESKESQHNQVENVWTTLPPSLISSNVWLPLDISTESVNELLRYLTLSEHLTCSTLDKALTKSRKYYGIICSAKGPISLTESDVVRNNLYAKKIDNSDLTVDLLNIRISTKTDEPTIMEHYLASLFGNNDDTELIHHLKASIPIAFAHNSVARKLTANLDTLIYKEDNSTEKENIYSFVVLPIGDAESSSSESEEPADEAQIRSLKKYDFCYINSSGRLVKILELLSKSMEEFGTILRKLGASEIFALYESEVGKLRREMEAERQILHALNPDLSMYPLYDDESLSVNDLREMSALSEEIDSAEDFELCIEGGDESMKSHESSAVSSSTSKEIRELEKRIRELAKKISCAKMELMEENGSNCEKYGRLKKDFYSSQEYLHFSKFYRENVLEKAGMTPKSGVKKSTSRIHQATSSSTIAGDATPSRKRKSTNKLEKDENTAEPKSSNLLKRKSSSSTKALREKNTECIAPTAQKRRSKRLNDADDNGAENREKSASAAGRGKKRKSEC